MVQVIKTSELGINGSDFLDREVDGHVFEQEQPVALVDPPVVRSIPMPIPVVPPKRCNFGTKI